MLRDGRYYPHRCRWFGHYWISAISGNPIDWYTRGMARFIVCRRCGAKPR